MSYVRKLEEEQKAAKAAVATAVVTTEDNIAKVEPNEVTPESYRYPPAQIVDGEL
jgi:hypothetical protein